MTTSRSTSSLDDTLKTPYAHTFNLVVGHELGREFSIEAAYVGRKGRNLLVRRDLAMPLNLKDPASGSDYYTAAKAVITQLENNGFDVDAVTPVPYFENMFPDGAFGGRSVTQNIADEYAFYYPDFTSALLDMDFYCSPVVYEVRAVLVLQRPVLLAGGAEHPCPRRLQRAAGHVAEALLARVSVRLELHVRAFQGSQLGHRARQRVHVGFRLRRLHGLPDQLVGT